MDARDSDRYKALTRRALVLGGLKISLFAVLAGRMYFLQVVDGEQYRVLAEKNRVNIRLLAPPRGVIRDRFGVELATNRQNLRVVLIPEQADDVTATLDGLANLVPLTDFNRTRLLREIKRTKGYIPVAVAENLTWEQFSSVNINMPDLSGVQPEIGETRNYPFGPMLAHCVGYVAQVPEGYPDNDPLLQLPGFRIGKSGLERTLDAQLRGRAGSSEVEVDAFGRSIRELSRQDGELGAEVVTTLDMELQRFAVERLGEESAASITLDVQTGEILALVSNPSFDPNAFNVGVSPTQYAGYLRDDHHPLINKASTGQYPPGSTFKLCVALAGLESGAIDANFRVNCNGYFHLGNASWQCWTVTNSTPMPPHGSVDLHGAIMHSCDVFFYEAALRIGADRIAAMGERLGLGAIRPDIGLGDEKAGVIPTKAWKQAARHAPMTPGEVVNMAIGQGEVLVTPLQLATMVARIANGSKAVMPHLVRSIGGVPLKRPEPADLGIAASSIQMVQGGAYSVVNDPGGTAYNMKARFDIGGAKMCGKSGTSQVFHRAHGDKRKLSEIPWHLKNHALFVGWTPHDAPRYCTIVIIEHGEAGSRVASPIVSDILQQALLRDPARMAVYEPKKPDSNRA